MLEINQLLSCSESYKQAFVEGLIDILNNKTAGTFILACANIFQHPELLTTTSERLDECYNNIKTRYQQCADNNQQPDDADDIAVMNRIISIGFHNLQPLQSKQINKNSVPYRVNFNQLRSLRPARMSSLKKISLNTPFNPDGFHFDKAFLKKEMFAEGDYKGHKISLLYNKFPFIDYHALLVVDKKQLHNQFLTKKYLDYIFQLQATTEPDIPELVTAYNSIGAGASVNHLHFQLFLESRPLAIFSSSVVHNGGTETYPANCQVFNSTEKCWQYLQRLHDTNTPYNLLFKNRTLFCLPRKIPSRELAQFNIASYGWSEMAGIFTLNNLTDFEQTTIDTLLETIQAVSAETI